MANFAAALAQGESGWVSNDLDLDEVETLDELVDLAREAVLDVGGDDATVLVFVEHDDEWFAVLRADLERAPQVFVSDARAALQFTLGELLLPEHAALRDEQVEEIGTTAGDVAESAHPAGPAGDAALLADLGLTESDLVDLTEQPRPADALAEIADTLGCPDPFESVR